METVNIETAAREEIEKITKEHLPIPAPVGLSYSIESANPPSLNTMLLSYGDVGQYEHLVSESDYTSLRDIVKKYSDDPSIEDIEIVHYGSPLVQRPHVDWIELESCYVSPMVYLDSYEDESGDWIESDRVKICVAMKATEDERHRWELEVYKPWEEETRTLKLHDALKEQYVQQYKYLQPKSLLVAHDETMFMIERNRKEFPDRDTAA